MNTKKTSKGLREHVVTWKEKKNVISTNTKIRSIYNPKQEIMDQLVFLPIEKIKFYFIVAA